MAWRFLLVSPELKLNCLLVMSALICSALMGCDDAQPKSGVTSDVEGDSEEQSGGWDEDERGGGMTTSISGEAAWEMEAGVGGAGESAAGEMVAGESSAGASAAGEMVAGDELAGVSAGTSAGSSGAGQINAGEEMMTSCEPNRAADAPLVAVGFPFGEEIGVPGQEVGLYQLTPDGALSAWGARVNVGFKAQSLSFSEDGWWLIALSEDGELAAIDLRDEPQLATTGTLPQGYFSAVQLADKPRRFDLVNSNNDEESGLYTVQLGCEGELEIEMNHYYLRLIQGFERFTGSSQDAIIFGGQALFDPVDLIDLRWVRDSGDGWTSIAQADLFEDHIDAINVGLSSRGDWVGAVNGSPFTEEGGQVRFIAIERDPPQLRQAQLFEGYRDVRGLWFLPDDSAALITQFEVGTVQVFRRVGDEWTPGASRGGLGLAEELALTPAPEPQSGWWAIVPNTVPTGGSQLTPVHVLSGGSITALSSTPLGSNATDLPGPVAAWPSAE